MSEDRDDTADRMDADVATLRGDVNSSLRFLNVMGMQTKYDLLEASARVFALIEELVAQGQLDLRSLDTRVQRLKERENERMRSLATVQVAGNVDKHSLRDLPQIDCASLIPLCKARCCTLQFPLSFQDLDEGVIKFDYSKPYMIRKREGSSYCCHNDERTGGCSAYAHRPAICRQYDCRTDRRIWADFERRIPAPMPGQEAPGTPEST